LVVVPGGDASRVVARGRSMVGTTSHQHHTLSLISHTTHTSSLFKLARRQAIGHTSDTTRICDAIQCCDIPSCTRRIACRRLSHTRHERTRGSGRHRHCPSTRCPLAVKTFFLECSNLLGRHENTPITQMSSRSLALPSAPPRNLYLNERFPATRDAMLVRVFQLARLEEVTLCAKRPYKHSNSCWFNFPCDFRFRASSRY
jgi:hypothetical protein